MTKITETVQGERPRAQVNIVEVKRIKVGPNGVAHGMSPWTLQRMINWLEHEKKQIPAQYHDIALVHFVTESEVASWDEDTILTDVYMAIDYALDQDNPYQKN